LYAGNETPARRGYLRGIVCFPDVGYNSSINGANSEIRRKCAMESADYYNKAEKLYWGRDYDEALETLTEGLGEYPDEVLLLELRAGVYERKGQKDKAIADYTRVVELDPNRADSWNYRGHLYQSMGEYDKAIADYSRCIPMSPPREGTYWSYRGVAYYEKGDLEAALADLTASIEAWDQPESTTWARYYRGMVLRKMGNLMKALDDFTLAAAYDPKDDDALYEAGYIWFVWRQFETAIEWFSKAIAVNDSKAANWLGRGVCYWNLCLEDNIGFWDEKGETMNMAIDDFTKAIECDPNSAEAHFNRGIVRCGMAQQSHQMINAIMTQKMADDTQRVAMLTELEQMGGGALVPQADTVLRGLRANRDDLDVTMGESFALFAGKDAVDAVEDLSRAIELGKTNPDAYYQRGVAYALLGKKDEALADYEKACILNPQHTRAAQKRDELRKQHGKKKK
jgi:tetratricopeptide (TPR) repeat protein